MIIALVYMSVTLVIVETQWMLSTMCPDHIPNYLTMFIKSRK
jgi:hypothetical protein